MIPEDIQKFRRPLETGSSFYCLYSGVISLGLPALGLGSTLFDPHREATLQHELAHWHTHTFTSTGVFLSYLHHCRMSAVLQVVMLEKSFKRPMFDYSDERVRTFIIDERGRQQRPSMREWLQMSFDQALFANKAFFLCSESPLNRTMPEGIKPEHFPFLPLAWALSGADAYTRGNPHQLEVILQVAELLARERVTPTFGADYLNTDMLFEAYSVIIEFLTLREFVPLAVLQVRFASIIDTGYGIPFKLYFRRVNKEASLANVLRHAAILLLLIEIALDPPIPPKYILHRENVAWTRIHPPGRFMILTSIFGSQFAANIDLIHTDTLDPGTYSDFADSFLAAIDKKREPRPMLLDERRYAQFRECLMRPNDFMAQQRIELIFATAQFFREVVGRANYRTLSQYLLLCEDKLPLFESAPCVITCDGDVKISTVWPKQICNRWWTGGMDLYIQDDIGVGRGPIDVLPFNNPKLKAQEWYQDACRIATGFADKGFLFDFHGLVN